VKLTIDSLDAPQAVLSCIKNKDLKSFNPFIDCFFLQNRRMVCVIGWPRRARKNQK